MISPKKFFAEKEKLVLTLLVKNEADIVLDNILYHYARGVDYIIVADNGSTDGTVEILNNLRKDGLIDFFEEKLYNQDQVVNKMGKMAKENHQATILIHSDADEFWTPLEEKNLKRAFLKLEKPSVLVDRKDVLPTPRGKGQKFPQKTMNIVTKHLLSDNIQEASKKTSLFLFRLPPKVMFSVKDGLKPVSMGNHLLANMDSGEVTDKIVIFHFPFKSVERFVDKVVMAGHVLESIPTDKETWWHWKGWYKSYKNGRLDKEIDILIPDLKTVKGLSYEKFDYKEKILDEIRKNKKLWSARSKYTSEINS